MIRYVDLVSLKMGGHSLFCHFPLPYPLVQKVWRLSRKKWKIEQFYMQSDVWNVSYVELRIWNQVSYDHRSYERNFKQLRVEAWKCQDFNGVEKGKKKSGLQRGWNFGSTLVEVLTFSSTRKGSTRNCLKLHL